MIKTLPTIHIFNIYHSVYMEKNSQGLQLFNIVLVLHLSYKFIKNRRDIMEDHYLTKTYMNPMSPVIAKEPGVYIYKDWGDVSQSRYTDEAVEYNGGFMLHPVGNNVILYVH